MHHGRKNKIRATSESDGGVQGAPAGGAEVRADVDGDGGVASVGLVWADGSVSCVLRRASERTSYEPPVGQE
jgi:hypothetical protein